MVTKCLRVLVATLGLYVVVSWLAPLHPLFEAVTNVRAQVAFLALLPVVGFLLLGRWRSSVIAAAVFGVLAAGLVPYWVATADAADQDTTPLRAMQFNIHFENQDYDTIVNQIVESDADIVAIHELLPQQWEQLDSRLARHYAHRLAQPLPETDGHPGGGMAILSRTPLIRQAIIDEVSPSERVVLVATTEVAEREVMLIGLHPHASRTEPAKVALRQRQLDGVASLVRHADVPAIIMTDLNIAPTSPIYQDFVADLGWVDPHRVVGWQSTWPSWGGAFGIPIDHVFVSNDFLLHGYERGSGGGSDHRSVTADLSLKLPSAYACKESAQVWHSS